MKKPKLKLMPIEEMKRQLGAVLQVPKSKVVKAKAKPKKRVSRKR